jgi:hypothetical protein
MLLTARYKKVRKFHEEDYISYYPQLLPHMRVIFCILHESSNTQAQQKGAISMT